MATRIRAAVIPTRFGEHDGAGQHEGCRQKRLAGPVAAASTSHFTASP